MRKSFVFLFFFVQFQSAFAQDKSDLNSTLFSVDFGSMRNRYLYPFTNLRCSSPLLNKVNVKFSLRVRSYGTLFFYSESAYDFTPQAEYYFTRTPKAFYFSAGLGVDARLRLVRDERGSAVSSAEAFVSVSAHGSVRKIKFTLPLWTRFYSDGIAFTLSPELSYPLTKNSAVFFRQEISYLAVYMRSATEWRSDNFIGAHFYF